MSEQVAGITSKANSECAKSSTLDKIRADNSFLSYLLLGSPSDGEIANALDTIAHQLKLIEELLGDNQ